MTLALQVNQFTQLLAYSLKMYGNFDTKGSRTELTGHLLSVGAGQGRDVALLLPMYSGTIVTIDKNVSPGLRELKKLRELGNGRLITLTLDFQDGDWTFPKQKLRELGQVFELTTMIFTANMLQECEFKHLME